MKKTILFFLIITLALLMTACGKKENHDTFAKCLSQNNVKMFGAFWCPHCANQKYAFGSSFQYVNYVECSNTDKTQNELCKNEKINSYPTWEFANKNRQEGELSLLQLSQLSGCSVIEPNT